MSRSRVETALFLGVVGMIVWPILFPDPRGMIEPRKRPPSIRESMLRQADAWEPGRDPSEAVIQEPVVDEPVIEEKQEEEIEDSMFKVDGVMLGAGRARAIINGSVVSEGEMVHGADGHPIGRCVSIRADTIQVRIGARTYDVQVPRSAREGLWERRDDR